MLLIDSETIFILWPEIKSTTLSYSAYDLASPSYVYVLLFVVRVIGFFAIFTITLLKLNW